MPTNKQLEQRINSQDEKLDKIIDTLTKTDAGVTVKEAVKEPEPVPEPVSYVSPKYREAVDKTLGKEFELKLSEDGDMLIVTVPERLTLESDIKARKSHHLTKRSEFNNFLTRTQPDIKKEVLDEKMADWDEKFPFVMPPDIRSFPITEAVIGDKFEQYCKLIRREIELARDIKLEPNK